MHTKSLQLFIRRLYKIPKTSSAKGMKREIKWETWRGKIRPCTSLPARARRRECKSAGGSCCQLPSWVEWRGSALLYHPRSFSRGSSLKTAFIPPMLLLPSTCISTAYFIGFIYLFKQFYNIVPVLNSHMYHKSTKIHN